jgi:uncharacterized protein YndB with AHSA1/START domain
MSSHRTGASRGLVGSVHAVDGKAVVRMEDSFDTDIDDLWSAITDPERLARWIGKVEGDLRLGGEFRASFTSSWEGPARIDVCEPPQRLLVTMDPGTDDETVVEAELSPDRGGTRIVVEERGLPIGAAGAFGAGWQAHIEDLAAHLAGRPQGQWRARWAELKPAYLDQQAALE